jgi:DNA polymerase
MNLFDRARRAEMWSRMRDEIRDCEKCVLCESRTRAVLHRGNKDATWCFLAEAPGEDEDLQGRVFVGASGKLFDKYIEDSKIPKGDWIAVNTLCCRPPKNKYPKWEVASVCIQRYLWLKLDLIQPTILVLIGRHAASYMLGVSKISQAAGNMYAPDKLRWPAPYLKAVFATYHPAYALRQPTAIGIIRSHMRFFVNYSKRQGWV